MVRALKLGSVNVSFSVAPRVLCEVGKLTTILSSDIPTAFSIVQRTIRVAPIFSSSENIARRKHDRGVQAEELTAEKRREAERLFLDVFRLDTTKTVSVSLGQLFPCSPVRFHPDNFAAVWPYATHCATLCFSEERSEVTTSLWRLTCGRHPANWWSQLDTVDRSGV
jgi:hypothetical protein